MYNCTSCDIEIFREELVEHLETEHMEPPKEDSRYFICCANCKCRVPEDDVLAMMDHCSKKGHDPKGIRLDWTDFIDSETVRLQALVNAGTRFILSHKERNGAAKADRGSKRKYGDKKLNQQTNPFKKTANRVLRESTDDLLPESSFQSTSRLGVDETISDFLQVGRNETISLAKSETSSPNVKQPIPAKQKLDQHLPATLDVGEFENEQNVKSDVSSGSNFMDTVDLENSFSTLSDTELRNDGSYAEENEENSVKEEHMNTTGSNEEAINDELIYDFPSNTQTTLICAICDHSVTTRGTKHVKEKCVRHALTHSKLKLYRCENCTYQTNRSNDMRRHSRIPQNIAKGCTAFIRNENDAPQTVIIGSLRECYPTVDWKHVLANCIEDKSEEKDSHCQTINTKREPNDSTKTEEYDDYETKDMPILTSNDSTRSPDTSRTDATVSSTVTIKETRWIVGFEEKCQHCNSFVAAGKNFASFKAAVVRHIAAHSPTKPFWCRNCNYKTSRRSDILRHVQTQRFYESGCSPNFAILDGQEVAEQFRVLLVQGFPSIDWDKKMPKGTKFLGIPF